MANQNLEELSFTELKRLYPDIGFTRSKAVLLEKIAEQTEVIDLEEVTPEAKVETSKSIEINEGDEVFTWYNIFTYIRSIAKTKTKVLIECPTTIEADFIWSRMSTELFKEFEKEGITIMGSSTRRDAHFNGTCYVRFVCHTNFAHLKRVFKYDTFKKLV